MFRYEKKEKNIAYSEIIDALCYNIIMIRRFIISLFAIAILCTSCLTLDDSSSEIDLDKLKSVIEENSTDSSSEEFEIPAPDGNIDDALETKYNAIAEPVSDENASIMNVDIDNEISENDNSSVSIVPSTEEKVNELIDKSLEDASETVNAVTDENGNFIAGTTQTLTPLKFDIAENLLENNDNTTNLDVEPVDDTYNVSEETLRADVSEEPQIRWEDEVYTPNTSSTTTISSGPVYTDNTRDILDEYNQFLAELGDDYKEAESVDNEEFEPIEPVEDTEEDIEWEEVPVEESKEEPGEVKEESKIKTFFVNLWSDFTSMIKGAVGKIKAFFVR